MSQLTIRSVEHPDGTKTAYCPVCDEPLTSLRSDIGETIRFATTPEAQAIASMGGEPNPWDVETRPVYYDWKFEPCGHTHRQYVL